MFTSPKILYFPIYILVLLLLVVLLVITYAYNACYDS